MPQLQLLRGQNRTIPDLATSTSALRRFCGASRQVWGGLRLQGDSCLVPAFATSVRLCSRRAAPAFHFWRLCWRCCCAADGVHCYYRVATLSAWSRWELLEWPRPTTFTT